MIGGADHFHDLLPRTEEHPSSWTHSYWDPLVSGHSAHWQVALFILFKNKYWTDTRSFCVLQINVLWCEKCKSIPEQQRRTLWRCWSQQVQKYLYPQSNESYIDITWNAAQQGRSHCSKTTIRKPDYGLQLHMGTKIVLFREMSSCLMKQK